MGLNLSVPTRSLRVLCRVELDPAKVADWLAELPPLDLGGTSNKLFSTLTTYNRIDIDGALRLKVLELYREPVHHICLELQKQYIGLPLPLSDKHKNIAERSRQFQIEMAFGYKQLVLEHLNTKAEHASATPAATPIQRALRYLTDILAISYVSYAPPPAGIWQEIHALYRHAETLRLAEAEVDDALNIARLKSSVSHAYKQALLLDLSDPNHLSARMIAKVSHYLDRWAGLAQLTVPSERFDSACQFLIDPGIDRAGVINTGEAITDGADYRLLNTIELARTIHAQLTVLQSGQEPALDGLERDFFADGGQELLLRLINVWGVNPQRIFRRTVKSDADIQLAIGIDAINYWLNGGCVLRNSSSFIGPEPERTAVGVARKKQTSTGGSDHEYSTWNLQDESAGGMALVKKGVIHTRVRVGDIVATRMPNQDDTWTIAVIRWARSASPSVVEIGTQRLSPSAQSIMIKTIAENGKESDFLPALLLPAVDTPNQPQTLVAPRGTFKPQRVLYVDDGSRLYPIIATTPVEVTNGFERFQYRLARL